MVVQQVDQGTDYAIRLRNRHSSSLTHLWTLLDQVCDPEIPVLSLWDLGVLTDIQQHQDRIVITITPTYSGCPALHTMREDIETTLKTAGIDHYQVDESLTPPWSSDWISPEGRRKLKQYGIAPPGPCQSSSNVNQGVVACPQCGSSHTRMVSEFGSTSCKALFQCHACLEPFDYFKPI